MEKITLKLFEFYNLDAELNGVVNPQTGAKTSQGLLQEKLPLITKYWLSSLGKAVAAEKAAVEELKNDLIRKYGKDDGKGGFTIPMLVDEVDEDGKVIETTNEDGSKVSKKKMNPDFQSFETEFNELLQTEKEVEYKGFKLNEFEKVETSENYETFFRLVTVD
jgi:hypothetical protein